VPFAVARAGFMTLLLYGLPILGVLLVLPTSQVTSLGGFLNAMKTVFTIYGGSVDANGVATLTGAGLVLGTIVALGFVWALATSGTTWIMSADRAQAVAGYDGAAPRFMGVISSRFGTPVTVNTLTGIVATIVMILAFAITNGDAKKYFSAVLGLAISTTTITYLPMFAGAIVLRYNKYRDMNRPYRVPFGNIGMWVCAALTVGFCVLATISVIWPGFGTSDPEAALSSLGWGGQRATFEIVQIAPLVVMALIGVVFYYLGAPTRRQIVHSVAPMGAMTAPAGD
jgi:amino acid transporter